MRVEMDRKDLTESNILRNFLYFEPTKEIENNHYVYILLNPLIKGLWKYNNVQINFKPFYVGMGIGPRDTVHSTPHSLKLKHNLEKNLVIEKILNENLKPISFKIKENIDISHAAELEKHLIQYFKRIKYSKDGILTNLSPGGEISIVNCLGADNIHSKKVYQYFLNGEFIRKWGAIREAARSMGISHSGIGGACKNNDLNNGKTYKASEYMWFYTLQGDKTNPYFHDTGVRKEVYVDSFDTLKAIGNYISTYHAAKALNISTSHIGKACVNKGRIHNFIFSYEKLSQNTLESIKKSYKYYVVTLNNKEHYLFYRPEVYKLLGIENNKKSEWEFYKNLRILKINIP